MRKSLFRYSGNKGRLLEYLPSPPAGTKRIIEPFLGSGSYTLSYGFEGLGVDADPNVISLWKFLQEVSPEQLRLLDPWWKERKLSQPPASLSEIEREFGKGASLYFKINVCGVYVGQWSSNLPYPQHPLPLDKTIDALPEARKIDVRLGDWKSIREDLREGDVVFFDPPYFGTRGNYRGEESFDHSSISSEILSWGVPVLFTYGTGAPEIFPEISWELLLKRKVPRIRGGGTIEREEWVARINWPREEDVLDMFSL